MSRFRHIPSSPFSGPSRPASHRIELSLRNARAAETAQFVFALHTKLQERGLIVLRLHLQMVLAALVGCRSLSRPDGTPVNLLEVAPREFDERSAKERARLCGMTPARAEDVVDGAVRLLRAWSMHRTARHDRTTTDGPTHGAAPGS